MSRVTTLVLQQPPAGCDRSVRCGTVARDNTQWIYARTGPCLGKDNCCLAGTRQCPGTPASFIGSRYYQDYLGNWETVNGCWVPYTGPVFAECTYDVTSLSPQDFQAILNSINQNRSRVPEYNWDDQLNTMYSTWCSAAETNPNLCPAQIGIVGYNPSQPRVGCSRFLTQPICQAWKNTGPPTAVAAAMTSFCAGKDVNQYSECSCIQPQGLSLYQDVVSITNKNPSLFGDNYCWWPPCFSTESDVVLVPQRTVTCPNVCQINGDNVENNVIDCFNQNSGNGGGGGGSTTPWYETAWGIAIIGAIIVLFIILVTVAFYYWS